MNTKIFSWHKFMNLNQNQDLVQIYSWIILAISTLLVAGWIGFFVFLPIKSGMSTIYELEDRFLPRAGEWF